MLPLLRTLNLMIRRYLFFCFSKEVLLLTNLSLIRKRQRREGKMERVSGKKTQGILSLLILSTINFT
jgi:hypothetical protein